MEEFPQNTRQEMKQEENKIENPKVKEGVDFVFEQNPKLAEIGNKEQYSEYLDNVFPKSIIKDIVWHGSKERIELFNKNRVGENTGNKVKGIFLTTNPKIATDYNPVLQGAVINLLGDKYSSETLASIKKSFREDLKEKLTEEELNEIESLTLDEIEEYTRSDANKTGKTIEDYLLEVGVTGEKFKDNENLEYYDFDNIRFLGTRLDIEKFKEFAEGQKADPKPLSSIQ